MKRMRNPRRVKLPSDLDEPYFDRWDLEDFSDMLPPPRWSEMDGTWPSPAVFLPGEYVEMH